MAVKLLRPLEQPLRAYLVRVQELHPSSGEHAVQGAGGSFGDGEWADGGERPGKLVEVHALAVEEEVQVPACPVFQVDGYGRSAA